MKQVFSKFHQHFTDRCERYPLLDIGEDSVRYDFFIALSEVKNLKSYEIQLEFAADKRSYVPRNTIGSLRKEKPQLDLVVNKEDLSICAEFGLFKQNSNDKGTINQTARTVKMINDMIRLGIDSIYNQRLAFFVCVADDKMLGHQLRTKILGRFPSDYVITRSVINEQQKSRTANLDDRFIKKFSEIGCEIRSNLVFNADIIAKKINRPTKILAWQVTATS